jgi:hypothetical protein
MGSLRLVAVAILAATLLASSVGPAAPVRVSVTSTTLPTCGNGQLDPGEECDQGVFRDAVCQNMQTDQSCRRCTTACTAVCALCDAMTPIDAFILPKVLMIKLDSKSPTKSKLVAAGILDTGPEAADLGSSASFDVGGVTVAAGTPQVIGGGFVLRGTGLVLRVVPARTHSSRALFRIKLQRDLTGLVNPNAPLTLHFANSTIDALGTVRLTDGRYRLHRAPGDLIAPTLYLASVRAKVQGGGKDTLALQLGLATSGQVPVAAPDVSVVFGPTYALRVPSGGFTRTGSRFTATLGGAQVVLDYQHELLTVRGRHIDLGTFVAGAQPVSVALSLGTEDRVNDVRLVRTGKALRY